MKSLAEQLSVYAAYHADPWNRTSHFVGVPLIVFALLIALSWLKAPPPAPAVTGAHLFVAGALVYYVLLDALLAAGVLAFTVPLLYAAARIAEDSTFALGAAVAAGAFVSGWSLQFAGHAIEGRHPAFVDNFLQLFIAPIFLVAELFFAVGLRRELRESVWGQAGARLSRRR
jgi:uncharacterized membrane protein YGL010W